MGTSIKHVSLTGSSGAGQLVNGQNTGKLKRVDGKILWIQLHVRQGSRCICQVSKHGDRRQLSKLTKALAMIVLVMGLEPSVAAGTFFFWKGWSNVKLVFRRMTLVMNISRFLEAGCAFAIAKSNDVLNL